MIEEDTTYSVYRFYSDEGELPTWEINTMYTIENETP